MSAMKKERNGATGAPAPPAAPPPAEVRDATPAGAAPAGTAPETEVPEAAPAAPSLMWSWCHGAPGIGLARLVALAHVDDGDVRHDLDVAIESTVANGFLSNDSLCHGDLGNLELLLRARERGFGGPWEETLASEASRLVERLVRGDWRCGIPGGVETPGLMMGLAGIGYGLLRLGATDRVPSLLSLEPPRCGTRAGAER